MVCSECCSLNAGGKGEGGARVWPWYSTLGFSPQQARWSLPTILFLTVLIAIYLASV